MIQTSKITEYNQIGQIDISNLEGNATLNLNLFRNLQTLNVTNKNNDISDTQLNFNNFTDIKNFSASRDQRTEPYGIIKFKMYGTCSSLLNCSINSSRVTSLILKGAYTHNSIGLSIGQIPNTLTSLNIQGNNLTGPDLTSILISFSGMADANNINGGYLNVVPYNNFAPILNPHVTNLRSSFRKSWISSDGKYQMSAALSGECTDTGCGLGYVYISKNSGIDFEQIISSGLPNSGRAYWRGCAASNNFQYIALTERSGQSYLSNNFGASFYIINTGLTSGQNMNNQDIAMSQDGKYINITINANSTYSSGILCASNDYGATFSAKTSLASNRIIGLGGVYWFATSISSDGRYQNACINGRGYGGIWVSNDYGTTWTQNYYMPGILFRDINTSANGKYQTAIAEDIYTSSDYGATWKLTYRDYYYGFKNSSWQGCVSISADGKYQIAAQDYNFADYPGNIYSSQNYGSNWQKSPLTGIWRSVALSDDGKNLIAGQDSQYLYTYRTDQIDPTYGVYFNIAYSAVTFLRSVKNWTVEYISSLFN